MADPLSALRDRYPEPDLRAALEAHLKAMLQGPAANVAPQDPQGVTMPNLRVEDFGRMRRMTADANAGPFTAQGNLQSFDGRPTGWSALLGYKGQF